MNLLWLLGLLIILVFVVLSCDHEPFATKLVKPFQTTTTSSWRNSAIVPVIMRIPQTGLGSHKYIQVAASVSVSGINWTRQGDRSMETSQVDNLAGGILLQLAGSLSMMRLPGPAPEGSCHMA